MTLIPVDNMNVGAYSAMMETVRRERHQRPRNLGPWVPPGMGVQAPYISTQTVFETREQRERHDAETCRRRMLAQTERGPDTTMEITIRGVVMQEATAMAIDKPVMPFCGDPRKGFMLDGELYTHQAAMEKREQLLLATRQEESDKTDPHTVLAFTMRALPVMVPTSEVMITGTKAYEQAKIIQLLAGRVASLSFDDETVEKREHKAKATKITIGRCSQTAPQDIFIMARDENLDAKDMEVPRWESLSARTLLAISCPNPLVEEASEWSEWEDLNAAAEEEAIVTILRPQTSTSMLGSCDACEFVRRGISASTVIGRQVYEWWESVHQPGACRTRLSHVRWMAPPLRFCRPEIEGYPCEIGKVMSWSVRPHPQDEESMIALFVTPTRLIEIEWEGRNIEVDILGTQMYMQPDKWFIVPADLRGMGKINLEMALRRLT